MQSGTKPPSDTNHKSEGLHNHGEGRGAVPTLGTSGLGRRGVPALGSLHNVWLSKAEDLIFFTISQA